MARWSSGYGVNSQPAEIDSDTINLRIDLCQSWDKGRAKRFWGPSWLSCDEMAKIVLNKGSKTP